MCKVSFIVPIYNVEKYIKKCVESILCQENIDIEVILVDDGSPDRSGRIIDELASEHECIKVIHKKNGGVSSARNAGMCISKGDYLLFVDGDDFIEPDYAVSFVGLIEKYGVDVAFSYKFFVNDDSSYNPVLRDGTISGDEACTQLYLNKIGVAVWNKIYKRSFVEKNRIRFHEEYWFAEGMTFNIECFLKSNKIAFTEKTIYHQTANANSAVRKFRLDSWYCGRQAMIYQKELINKCHKDVLDAWNYHYREYNYSILRGIIKSHSEEEYQNEMRLCIKNLKKDVLYPIKVNISIRMKIKSILIFLNPIFMAKRDAEKELIIENR